MQCKVQWKRLGQVLAVEAGPTWALLVGVIGTWALSFPLSANLTDQVRYTGTLLQLLGLWTVARGISDLRESFGKPTLKERLVTWLQHCKDALVGKSGSAQATGTPFTVTAGVMEVLTPTARCGATVEERVDALEKALEKFRNEHDEHINQIRSNISHVVGQLQEEGNARNEADVKLFQKLEEVAVGGIRLEVIGLVWLILGMLGTSIPKEIANLIP